MEKGLITARFAGVTARSACMQGRSAGITAAREEAIHSVSGSDPELVQQPLRQCAHVGPAGIFASHQQEVALAGFKFGVEQPHQ